ncbi:16S rRNA (cytosine(1402)-N(4))-methyltransferase RsmH [Candidatus Saccharibacteria bacterium]|nr:16S rRNA (cytosine(1402)-N(4))-methyltransferase RsmH [Candidatus Saccharibacteria bacterium]
MTEKNHQYHVPVLIDEVIRLLSPKPGDSILDLTAGYGGHSKALRAKTEQGPITLVDRDETAIKQLKTLFKDKNANIIHSDFLGASKILLSQDKSYDIILADLGLSSVHLNIASRGFSIKHDGPLDMRMNQAQDLTAYQVVNKYSEQKLVSILKEYGEEYRAESIVHNIVNNRPIETTQQLAEVVKKSFRGHSKVHPATKTFQAIRIEVNEELSQLAQALQIWIQMLKPGGRLAVISFHSLEDRLVKEKFADLSKNKYEAELQLLTKRPVLADKNELVFNPRARSAKLRVAVKIKKERGTHAYTG